MKGAVVAENMSEFRRKEQSFEKIVEASAERVLSDALGGCSAGGVGAKPLAVGAHDLCSVREAEIEKKALHDATELNEPMVSGDLPLDVCAVGICLHVDMLIAGVAPNACHELHPKVVLVGSERVYGLAEADLDAEAVAVDGKNLAGSESGVARHEEDTPALRMIDGDEANETGHGPPNEIQEAEPHADALFAEEGALHDGERSRVVKELAKANTRAIELWSATLRSGLEPGPSEGDGVAPDARHELVAVSQEGIDDLAARIVRVGNQDEGTSE